MLTVSEEEEEEEAHRSFKHGQCVPRLNYSATEAVMQWGGNTHAPISGPPSNRPTSLRICARLSAPARSIGNLRCLSFNTSSWMTCSNRSQHVGVLARYIALEDRPCLRLSLVPYVRYTRESERVPLILAGRCHRSICGPVPRDDTDYLLCRPIA